MYMLDVMWEDGLLPLGYTYTHIYTFVATLYTRVRLTKNVKVIQVEEWCNIVNNL